MAEGRYREDIFVQFWEAKQAQVSMHCRVPIGREEA